MKVSIIHRTTLLVSSNVISYVKDRKLIENAPHKNTLIGKYIAAKLFTSNYQSGCKSRKQLNNIQILDQYICGKMKREM